MPPANVPKILVTIAIFLIGIIGIVMPSRASAQNAGDFSWPLGDRLSTPVVTQDYTCRGLLGDFDSIHDDSCFSIDRYHSGLDLRAQSPIPVYASAAGIIVTICVDGSTQNSPTRCDTGNTTDALGTVIVIRHDTNLFSLYAHLSEVAAGLTEGQTVINGEQIALSGETGVENFPHLHFEIRDNDNLISSHIFASNVYPSKHPNLFGYLDPWAYISTTHIQPAAIKIDNDIGVNVRRGPGIEYSTFTSLDKGQLFVANARLTRDGDIWYRIDVPCGNGDSCAGWIAGQYNGGSFSFVADTASFVEINFTDYLGLRVRETPNGVIVTDVYAYDGQRFAVADSISGEGCTDNWYEIYTPAASTVSTGWICGDYLTLTSRKVKVPVAIFALLGETDTTPPSVPTGLTIAVDSSSQISVSWSPSTDDTLVSGYNIYRDGVLHDSVAGLSASDLSYVDTGLTALTQYCYKLSALDAAGNESAQSASECGTTFAATPGQVTKVIDSNAILPGGGSFTCLGLPPITVDQGKILFLANFFFGPLFTVENGNIRRVADTSTALPGAMPRIPGFLGFDNDGSKIYISAGLGIYVEEAGNLSLIADLETTTPGGDQKFGGFYDVVADNGLVTFHAASDPNATALGIYQFDGLNIEVIVDFGTPDPAGSGAVPNTFTDFSGAPGLVVFGATDHSTGYSGIYVHDGNNLLAVANTNTAFPGGRDIFISPDNTIDDGGRILFNASDGNISHPFYQWLMGSVSLTIDVPMILDGTTTVLNGWKGYWAADATRIVTQNLTDDGQGNSTIGLYLHQNDSITKLIDTNDVLDGKAAYDLFPIGLDGDSLVFVPWFVDDSCGIYKVDLN